MLSKKSILGSFVAVTTPEKNRSEPAPKNTFMSNLSFLMNKTILEENDYQLWKSLAGLINKYGD